MKKLFHKIDEYMSQIIVIFSISIILIFTVVNILVTYLTGHEVSATLTEQFFQFFGYELLILGGIKISKHATNAVLSIFQLIKDRTNTKENLSYEVMDTEENNIES